MMTGKTFKLICLFLLIFCGFVAANRLAGAERSALQEALAAAKPTSGHPNQVMTTLDDGTRVLFRKDFGAQAHPLNGPFKGAGNVDHYNIQIQSGTGKTLENLHIVPDGKGGYIWWGKNGIVKP